MDEKTNRKGTYFLLLLLTIGLGLLSRSPSVSASSFFGKYGGDTLWAIALYGAIALIFPHIHVRKLTLVSLLIAFAVEASQLYHTPWIDHLRAHRIAALFLGFQFLWIDIACYTLGIIIAATIDKYSIRNLTSPPRTP